MDGVSKFYYYDAKDHLTRQTSFSDGFTVGDEYFFWGPGRSSDSWIRCRRGVSGVSLGWFESGIYIAAKRIDQ
jgi:hypothetical protein